MKKSISAMIAAAMILCVMPMTAHASEWRQGADGRWWYQHDDGGCTKNGWEKIDGKDYYFDADGWMLSNTTTPDGYQVGADGVWIQNAIAAQTQTPQDGYFADYCGKYVEIGVKEGDRYSELASPIDSQQRLEVLDNGLTVRSYSGASMIQYTLTFSGIQEEGVSLFYTNDENTGFIYGFVDGKRTVAMIKVAAGTKVVFYYGLIADVTAASSNTAETGTTSSATSSTSDISYLAAMDFRGIKSEYPKAEPLGAYVKSFKLNGDKCAVVYLQYKIINNYSETFLHNISDGTRITDPVNYYKKQGSRAFGRNKIKAIDDQTTVLKAISAAMQNGEYIAPSVLDPQ